MLFTGSPVQQTELEYFLFARGGQYRPDRLKINIGSGNDWVFVSPDTSTKNAIIDLEEAQEFWKRLGYVPPSCVDLHFTGTEGALNLANTLALEMKTVWGGVIDYEAADGGLGLPPRGLPASL